MSNIHIHFEYPWWFIILCALVGVVIASLLYFKGGANYLTITQRKFLAAFRFVVITLLCILLLSPLLEMRRNNIENPAILFFQDNSQSLLYGRDSTFMQQQYPDLINDFTTRLSDNYPVHTYVFGEQTRNMEEINFQDRITDMSQIFTSLKTWYGNRNIGAVIIAGDGIFNRGSNPIYEATSSYYPVYTLALGDTIQQTDLLINRLRHNTITYLNNIFPLEINIEANMAAGKSSLVKVIHNNQPVFEQRVVFTSDNHAETLMAEIKAEETGIKRYRVEIEPIENEISVVNNQKEFFIEVIDSRQKVLILAHGPHPDIGAIKQALEDNDNYEVEVSLLENFKGSLPGYDLIVWHQLPSRRFPDHVLFQQAADMPQIFVLGAQSHLQAFNSMQTGLQVITRTQGSNDARAHHNESFNLFSISESTRNILPYLPPLHTAFANYNLSPATQSFLFQRIGSVNTQYPLITFSEIAGRKTAVIAGEGIWRWRLANFARTNDHSAFNELISRMIQFISVVEDKSFFRVNTQNFIHENEPVLFDAELYNRSYELINEPEVQLAIINEEGIRFEYIMGRTINAYALNAGSFPSGEYTYTAQVSFGGEILKAEGRFSVSPLNIEGNRTLADHQLLYQIASQTDAEMFYPDQLEDLYMHIRSRNDIRPVLYAQKEFEDVIHLRWIFFIILVFLASEWFIRKYSGGY